MTVHAPCGVLYIASGLDYLSEAQSNAFYSKQFCDLPFAIFTDQIDSVDDRIFDYKFNLDSPAHSYRDKIYPLTLSPFEYTLFLDSDARLIHSPNDLFSLLQTYDICASKAPVRLPLGWIDSDVPLSFHEFNSGVILFRNTRIIHDFISDWLILYDKIKLQYNQSWDQATFRSTLFSFISTRFLKFFTLPCECNLRTTKPWIAGRGSPVYVIHGRFDNSESLDFISYLNSDIDKFRTFSDWIHSFPDSSIRPRFDRTYD